MTNANDLEQTLRDRSAMLKALGEPTRLRIFEFLCGCCCPVAVDDETGDVRPVEGPTVGEVCCHLTGQERVTSTISEHLKELRVAGLITTERRGKNVVCAVNREAVAALAGYLASSVGLSARQGETGNRGACC